MLRGELLPLGARAPGEHPLDLAVRLGAGPLELLLDQVLAPHPATPRLPELRLERADRHPAVRARVGPVADQRACQLEPPALRRACLGEVARRHQREPGQRPVEHRHVHELALAASLALAQRRQDPERGHQRAAAQVGDLPRRLDRRAALVAGQSQQPVEPEVVHVVARALRVGAVLAVAGDRAVDEPGVLLAQALVADPEPLHHPRPKRLEQHVVLAHQPQQHLAPGVGLQVEPDRALAAVEGEEERGLGRVVGALVVGRRPADVVAHPGVLDLEHVGPEVGQQQRAEAARQQPRQVEHLDPGERAHAGTVIPPRPRRGVPSSSRASATVATRRPTSSTMRRARAIRSPLERAISPSGR